MHIFKSITLDNCTEDEAYDKAIGLKHNVQRSVIDLLLEIGEYHKIQIQAAVSSVQDQNFQSVGRKAIEKVDGFMNTIRNLPTRLQLEENYVKNIEGYSEHVGKYYAKHIKDNVPLIQSSPPDYIFLTLVSCVGTLYPCLFKMDTITRYPDKKFNYRNLDLLNNQQNACRMVKEMLRDLIIIVSDQINPKRK